MVELNDGDHLGARAPEARQLRQVAGERPRLVDQPQPVLGLADPGVAQRRPDVPAGRRVRLDRRAGGRLRRHRHRPPPTGRRRARAAQPRRPDGALDDAPRAGGARLLVRVGLDAVRPGALPVREPGVVRGALPRRLHRRVHGPDPRLVLHVARAGDGAVRPAGVPHLREPRHRPRPGRPEDVEDRCATTRTRWRCSTATAPTPCAGTCSRRRSCGATTSRSRRPGCATRPARSCCRSWNAWYFLALYANVAGHHGRASGPSEQASDHVLDRYVLAKTRQLVEEMTVAMDAYDLFGACARVRSFVDVLTNWYIRRSRQRFWDGDPAAIDTLHTTLDVLVRVAAPLLPFVTEAIHGGLRAGRGGRADERPPHRLAGPGGAAGRRRARRRRWTRCATSARPRCRCARPTGAGCASRWPASPSPCPTPSGWRRSPRSSPTRSTCATSRSPTTSPPSPASVLQVLPAALGPRLGRHTQDVIRAVKAGDWRLEGERVEAGGHWLEPGEYTLTMVADDDQASTTLGRRHRRDRARRRPDPRARAGGRARDLIRLDPAGPARRRPRRHRPHRRDHHRRPRVGRRRPHLRGPHRRRDAGRRAWTWTTRRHGDAADRTVARVAGRSQWIECPAPITWEVDDSMAATKKTAAKQPAKKAPARPPPHDHEGRRRRAKKAAGAGEARRPRRRRPSGRRRRPRQRRRAGHPGAAGDHQGRHRLHQGLRREVPEDPARPAGDRAQGPARAGQPAGGRGQLADRGRRDGRRAVRRRERRGRHDGRRARARPGACRPRPARRSPTSTPPSSASAGAPTATRSSPADRSRASASRRSRGRPCWSRRRSGGIGRR